MSGQAQTGPAVGGDPAVPPEPTVRLAVAVLAVLASVVVALLVVALVVRLDVDRLPSGPPRDPPPAPPEASTFSVDSTRTAHLEEFSMVLAGPPFVCSDTMTPPTGFTAYVACSHVVHEDYDATGHDWAAVTGLLLVPDPLVTPGDLDATARSVFDALVPQFYSTGDHPSVGDLSTDVAPGDVPAGRSASVLANVKVRAKGLATPYDRLVVAVVQLESGRHVAFFSDFPHDDSKAALQAVAASANTISARR